LAEPLAEPLAKRECNIGGRVTRNGSFARALQKGEIVLRNT